MLRLRSTMLASVLLAAPPIIHADDENASWTFDTYTPGVCSPNGGQHGGCPAGELVRINVVTVAHGFVRPWHLTFLPGGTDYLVTELPGALRVVRNGKLDANAIPRWRRNEPDWRRAADPHGADLEAFVELWSADLIRREQASAKDLFRLAEAAGGAGHECVARSIHFASFMLR